MDATERKVMAALTRRGHYPETPDGFAWAVVDAEAIVAAWRESNGGPTAVARAMADTGLHDIRSTSLMPGEVDCFHGDQDAVWDVFRAVEPA